LPTCHRRDDFFVSASCIVALLDFAKLGVDESALAGSAFVFCAIEHIHRP
jgi:hypothetical protein